jgi:hypothetical protein
MADDKKTVQVTATQAHSYHGENYEIGDTYDADEGDVVTIQVQGKGYPSDPKALAKSQEKAAKPAAPMTRVKKGRRK